MKERFSWIIWNKTRSEVSNLHSWLHLWDDIGWQNFGVLTCHRMSWTQNTYGSFARMSQLGNELQSSAPHCVWENWSRANAYYVFCNAADQRQVIVQNLLELIYTRGSANTFGAADLSAPHQCQFIRGFSVDHGKNILTFFSRAIAHTICWVASM